jgi:hypothetical protein
MTKTATEYDRTEAEAMLSRIASTLVECRRGKLEAAQQLSDAFLQLHQFAGIQIVNEGGTIEAGLRVGVRIGNKVATVTFDLDRLAFRVGRVQVFLHYNAATGCFEGDRDHFYEPLPGEPPRTRAALAVLVEAVIANLAALP